MKIGLVGNNDGPLRLARSLKRSGIEVLFTGLQNNVATSLKDTYRSLGSETDLFMDFGEPELINRLDLYSLDLLINCFCNFRFREVLNRPFPVLNVHLSPLPKYRGRHPLQWALINGEKEFGFSVHQMTPEFDAGPVYWQETVPVNERMSVEDLRSALMKKLEADFGDFMHRYIHEELSALPNDDTEATYAPRRYPADSELTEWSDSNHIFRKVMALRSESYRAFIRMGELTIPLKMAERGIKLTDVDRVPAITEIDGNVIKVICGDGQVLILYSALHRVPPSIKTLTL